MMLPIAAQFARNATTARARSALPDAPVIRVSDHDSPVPGGRRRPARAPRAKRGRLEPAA